MANQPLILIVDDEPAFREIMSAKFSAAGFRMQVAANGEESAKKAKGLKPDLILMDIKMPGISGVEAFLKIKADPETKDTKTLFLTSLGDPRTELQEVDRRFAREIGAVDYIKKTDDLDKMVERIKIILKK